MNCEVDHQSAHVELPPLLQFQVDGPQFPDRQERLHTHEQYVQGQRPEHCRLVAGKGNEKNHEGPRITLEERPERVEEACLKRVVAERTGYVGSHDLPALIAQRAHETQFLHSGREEQKERQSCSDGNG